MIGSVSHRRGSVNAVKRRCSDLYSGSHPNLGSEHQLRQPIFSLNSRFPKTLDKLVSLPKQEFRRIHTEAKASTPQEIGSEKKRENLMDFKIEYNGSIRQRIRRIINNRSLLRIINKQYQDQKAKMSYIHDFSKYSTARNPKQRPNKRSQIFQSLRNLQDRENYPQNYPSNYYNSTEVFSTLPSTTISRQGPNFNVDSLETAEPKRIRVKRHSHTTGINSDYGSMLLKSAETRTRRDRSKGRKLEPKRSEELKPWETNEQENNLNHILSVM